MTPTEEQKMEPIPVSFSGKDKNATFPRSLGVKPSGGATRAYSSIQTRSRTRGSIFGTGDDHHGTVASGVPCPWTCCASRVLGPVTRLPCAGLGERKDLVRGGEPFLPRDACAHAARAHAQPLSAFPCPPSHNADGNRVMVSAECLASIPSASSSSRPSP